MALIKIKLLAEKQNESTHFFSRPLQHWKKNDSAPEMLHILRISGVLPAQKFQPPRIRVWSCSSKSGIIWISVGTKIYLVYCTSKTNICFYILQIVGNQKKKKFPPNNLTSFYREQNMRKKNIYQKTINRCYNPPPSNTAVATYNNQSAIGKKSKSFKPPPKEKKSSN